MWDCIISHLPHNWLDIFKGKQHAGVSDLQNSIISHIIHYFSHINYTHISALLLIFAHIMPESLVIMVPHYFVFTAKALQWGIHTSRDLVQICVFGNGIYSYGKFVSQSVNQSVSQ